jgi:hypothetical protein
MSYKFTFLITEMLEICIQTSYDQNVQLILKSNLPVVYGTPFYNITITMSSLQLQKCAVLINITQ